jgi:hypothetical protein
MLLLPQREIGGTGEFSKKKKKKSRDLSETEVHGKEKDRHLGLSSTSVATVSRVRASAIIFLPTAGN